MKLKINKNLIKKEEWFDFDEEISFKIRPFPASHNVLRNFEQADIVDINWKMFDYSVVDWKGIIGDDNKSLECNSDNKKELFGFSKEVMVFVFNNISEKNDKIIEKKT